ncbi:MAG: hypothetical protein ACQET7_04970 [Thermodesulfobacteriota bacterium]
MEVTYLASSPNGDIPLGPDHLSAPFRLSLDESHPFLSLGDYLNGLRDFLLADGGRMLSRILGDKVRHEIPPEKLGSLLIRTEKHGAMYHVASIEIQAGLDQIKLCSSTAFSEQARNWLTREVETLKELHRRFGLPHLPVPVLFGKAAFGSGNREISALVLLADWFEGFHEWHLNAVKPGGRPRVEIWDQARGYRWATEGESRSLFRGATRILSRYYDPDGFMQVRAWHHAAGDFVVRPRNNELDVRLTTARAYTPLPGLSPADGTMPAVALAYFFLDTVLRMRLDRKEGVGKALWAGDDALEAAVEGFFAGLAQRRLSGGPVLEENTKVLDLLCSFSTKDLLTLHGPVLGFLAEEAVLERALIESRLDDHVTALHRVLPRVRG